MIPEKTISVSQRSATKLKKVKSLMQKQILESKNKKKKSKSEKNVMFSITLTQAFINIGRLSPFMKYNGVQLCSTSVEWIKSSTTTFPKEIGNFFCPVDSTGNIPFGVADLMLPYTASSPLKPLQKTSPLPISVGLDIKHPFIGADKTETLYARVDLSEWINTVKRKTDYSKKDSHNDQIYKSQIFRLPLNSDEREDEVGEVHCLVEVFSDYHRKFKNTSQIEDAPEKSSPYEDYLAQILSPQHPIIYSMVNGEESFELSSKLSHLLKIDTTEFLGLVKEFVDLDTHEFASRSAKMLLSQNLVYKLSRKAQNFNLDAILQSDFAERVADHICNIYNSEDIEFTNEIRVLLRNAVDSSKDDNKRTNELAFFKISELICINDVNPIDCSSKVINWAQDHAANWEASYKPIRAQRWKEIEEKCTEMAYNFLDVAANTVPSEVGDIGKVWMKNLIRKAPDAALRAGKSKMAGHDICVDAVTERWNTRYTNWFCGSSIWLHEKEDDSYLIPKRKSKRKFLLNAFLHLFDSPFASFWWGFLLYLTFVGIFTAFVAQSDEGLAEFQQTLVNRIVQGEKSFVEIGSSDDFWVWSKDVLSNRLFIPDNTSTFPFLGTNLTLRQFRVKASECENSITGYCYQSLLPDESNWEKGGVWKESSWMTESGIHTSGKFFTVPPGGYVITFSEESNEILEKLSLLENSTWIDGQTRAVVIEFVVYHPNGYYGICSMIVEWSNLGGIAPSYFFYILPLKEIANADTSILQVLIIIFVLGYMVQEIFQFAVEKRKWEYLKDFWNLIDFLIFFLYLAMIFVFACIGYYSSKWDNYDPLRHTFKSLYDTWVLYTVLAVLQSFFFMLFWGRLVFFLRLFESFGPILKITEKLVLDVVQFSIFLAFIIGASALLMDVLLRSENSFYSSFGKTFVTLGYAAVGHGEFIDAENGSLGPVEVFGNILFYIYSVGVTILLINLLIALMNNTYQVWYDQAVGLWVLESVAIIQQYETILFPAPFNLITIPFFWIRSCFTSDIYYHKARKSAALDFSISFENIKQTCFPGIGSETIPPSNSDYDYRNIETVAEEIADEELTKTKTYRKLEEHTDPANLIWIISTSQNDIVNLEETQSSKTFQIINQTPFNVKIYLRLGAFQSHYLTILPNTTAHLASKFSGFAWTAYSDCDQSTSSLSYGTEVENTGNLIYPSYYKLVLHEVIIGSYCNSCGKTFSKTSLDTLCIVPEQYAKIPEKLKEYNLITCLPCYYRAEFDYHVKQNRAPAIIKRASWWERGRFIEFGTRKYSDLKEAISISGKKPGPGSQNELVKLLVQKYLTDKASKSSVIELPTLPPYEEPEEPEDENETITATSPRPKD